MIIIDQTYETNRSCQSSAQNPIMVLISWIMKIKVFPVVSQVSHDWYNHQSPKSLISSPATVQPSFILHQLQLFFSHQLQLLFSIPCKHQTCMLQNLSCSLGLKYFPQISCGQTSHPFQAFIQKSALKEKTYSIINYSHHAVDYNIYLITGNLYLLTNICPFPSYSTFNQAHSVSIFNTIILPLCPLGLLVFSTIFFFSKHS